MLRQLLGSQLRRNMLAGPISTLVNLTVTFVGYPLYLGALGYEQYGVWLVLATVVSFTQLSNLGMGSALMKLVAEERGKGATSEIGAHTATAVLAVVVSCTVAAVVAIAFRGQIVRAFGLQGGNASEAVRLLPVMAVLSGIALVSQLYGAVLSGLGRMDLSSYIDSAGRVVGLAASVALLQSGWQLSALVTGTALSYLVTQVLVTTTAVRLGGTTTLSLRRANRASFRRLASVGLGMFASSLVALLLHPLNRLVVARWCGVARIPIYELAYSAAMQLRGLAETAFRAMAPEVSALSARGLAGVERVISLVRRAERLAFGLGLPAWLAIGAAAPALMQLWLGGRFDVAIPSNFRVIQVGTFASLLCVPAFYALVGLGRAGQVLAGNVVQSAGNVIALGVLAGATGHLGERGVSAAAALGMTVAAGYVVFASRRAVGDAARAAAEREGA